MGYALAQNQTAQPLLFLLVQSADHLSPATGLAPTVTLSKNGAAFAAPAGAVTEVGNGWYKCAGNAADANTLGPLLLHATAATADPTDEMYPVVAYNPLDAAALGLTNLAAAAPTAAQIDTQLSGTHGAGAWGGAGGGPTAAQVATAVWQDLTASADFGTAGSAGALLKGNLDAAVSSRAPAATALSTTTWTATMAGYLDANVSSRLAASSYTPPPTAAAIDTQLSGTHGAGSWAAGAAPPTAAQVAAAVWQDLTAGADFSTAGSIGLLLKTDVDAQISTRLPTSGYTAPTTPPTAAAVATAVWTDLTTGADFSTANSVGLLVKTDLDANIGSRLAASGYTTPPTVGQIDTQLSGTHGAGSWLGGAAAPTAAQVAAAVWQDLTSSADFATAGSIGVLLKTDVDAQISTRLPTSSYAAPPTPPTAASIATAVWTDLTAGTDFATAGSVGALVKADLDAAISSRAPAATALSTATWTAARAANLDNLDAAVSSRLAAAGYTIPPTAAAIDAQLSGTHGSGPWGTGVVPPTAAQVAAAVWQDLLAGADFGTAGSVGALVKADLDAAVSSRAPAATALSTATWTAARAANLDNLDAAVSTRSTYAGADTAGTTTLLARLSAARAGYLDNLNVGGPVSTYAGADTAGTSTLLSRLTAARAGYLDNLAAGPVALSSQLTGGVALSLTQAVPATGNTPNTVGDCLNAARAQGFGAWSLVGTGLTMYAPDGSTAVRQFALDSATAPSRRT